MIPSLACRVLGKVGQAQIKNLRPMRFPFSFSKTWRVPATVKPVLESNFRRLPAVACLFVALLCAALPVRGAEESVVRIDRSREGIAKLRSDLIEWGCSREMSNRILALTRLSDLRTDEIDLVVHYAVFCPGPNAGELFLNSMVANRDFKEIKLAASRRLVIRAFQYFGNDSMFLALGDLEDRLSAPEEDKVARLSDADIRREIAQFKESPEPALRDRLRQYAGSLVNPPRLQVASELVNALLESDPGDPDLLSYKGMLALGIGDHILAKETLAKAWQSKYLPALLPYAAALVQLDDLSNAGLLVDDLIAYKRWADDIPKVLMFIAFMLQKEPERYRTTIDKILATVNAADLKDEEGKQIREKVSQRWNEIREKD